MKLRRGKGRGTRRHETDVRCGHKKLKSSSSLVFTLEAAIKRLGKKLTLLPNLLLATQVYSRPSALVTSLENHKMLQFLWRIWIASPPDGEAGHQPCGRVRLRNGEPLRIAVDLSASLPGNKINNNKMLFSSWSILARSHQYIIMFFKDGAMHCLPCAR